MCEIVKKYGQQRPINYLRRFLPQGEHSCLWKKRTGTYKIYTRNRYFLYIRERTPIPFVVSEIIHNFETKSFLLLKAHKKQRRIPMNLREFFAKVRQRPCYSLAHSSFTFNQIRFPSVILLSLHTLFRHTTATPTRSLFLAQPTVRIYPRRQNLQSSHIDICLFEKTIRVWKHFLPFVLLVFPRNARSEHSQFGRFRMIAPKSSGGSRVVVSCYKTRATPTHGAEVPPLPIVLGHRNLRRWQSHCHLSLVFDCQVTPNLSCLSSPRAFFNPSTRSRHAHDVISELSSEEPTRRQLSQFLII